MADNEKNKWNSIFKISLICLIGLVFICLTIIFIDPVEVSGELECDGLFSVDTNSTDENLSVKNIDITSCKIKFDSKVSFGSIGRIVLNR